MQLPTAFVLITSVASLVAGAAVAPITPRQNNPTLDPGAAPFDYTCEIAFILEGCCFSSRAACRRQGRNDCDNQSICPEGVTVGSNGTPGCGADCCSTTTGFGIGCPK